MNRSLPSSAIEQASTFGRKDRDKRDRRCPRAADKTSRDDKRKKESNMEEDESGKGGTLGFLRILVIPDEQSRPWPGKATKYPKKNTFPEPNR